MSQPSIVVERLRRRFGNFVAVDDVSFEVQGGEIFGYLGANGAGKSTTIRMLCGLLTPTSGHATVAGCRVGPDTTQLRSRIGYMSQRFSLYLDLPVDSNVEFFGGAYGLYGSALRRRRDEILERIGLTELRHVTTSELPSGLRQRLALGTALLHRPEIVFLDEPTAGVDPAARRLFWTLIRELARDGTTVFVTTHYMDEAEYCARIGLMVAGKLVALDAPSQLKADWVPGSVIAVYGCDLETARTALAHTSGIHAVDSFGAKVHVRYDPSQLGPSNIESRLREDAGGRALSFEPTDVSLEDVFLAAVAEGASGRSPKGAA